MTTKRKLATGGLWEQARGHLTRKRENLQTKCEKEFPEFPVEQGHLTWDGSKLMAKGAVELKLCSPRLQWELLAVAEALVAKGIQERDAFATQVLCD